jgi:hypothetical protein
MFWSVSFSVSHCISASRLLAMTNLGNKRYRQFWLYNCVLIALTRLYPPYIKAEFLVEAVFAGELGLLQLWMLPCKLGRITVDEWK